MKRYTFKYGRTWSMPNLYSCVASSKQEAINNLFAATNLDADDFYTIVSVESIGSPFIKYTDDELDTMYHEEYIPYTKTGVLPSGELLSILDSEDSYNMSRLEVDFLKELVKRLI